MRAEQLEAACHAYRFTAFAVSLPGRRRRPHDCGPSPAARIRGGPGGTRGGAARVEQHGRLPVDRGSSRRREQRAAGAFVEGGRPPYRAALGKHAATGARTRSAPSFSTPWPCCGPRSCTPRTALDGAEQYFTRAVDFGYSFSIEETFERWGREEILGDFVRMIRTIRPDVVSAMSPEGRGGGQHHQASAVLAHEAWRAAADPGSLPGAESPRGWLPGRRGSSTTASDFPFGMGVGPPGFRFRPARDADVTTVDLGGYDPLLGATWAEVGSLARGMHKCQGMGQFIALPAGPAGGRYRLARDGHCGPLGGRRRLAVRRGGYLYRRARALRRRRRPGRARPRTGRAGPAGARGARSVRRRGDGRRPRAGRSPVSTRYAPCRGSLPADGVDRRRPARDRSPPGDQGAAVRAGCRAGSRSAARRVRG